jgi:hypothetical protein
LTAKKAARNEVHLAPSEQWERVYPHDNYPWSNPARNDCLDCGALPPLYPPQGIVSIRAFLAIRLPSTSPASFTKICGGSASPCLCLRHRRCRSPPRRPSSPFLALRGVNG